MVKNSSGKRLTFFLEFYSKASVITIPVPQVT